MCVCVCMTYVQLIYKMMNTHVDVVWHIVVSILQYKYNYSINVKHNIVFKILNLDICFILVSYSGALIDARYIHVARYVCHQRFHRVIKDQLGWVSHQTQLCDSQFFRRISEVR